MIFLSAIHGIHTKLTNPSWPWRFQAWTVRKGLDVVLQADHYWAYAFAPWNTHVLNPRNARAVVRRLELLKSEFPNIPVSMVAHSNGTDIAVKAVKLLVELGFDVDTIVLVAGAVDSDVEKNGLLPLIRRGNLKRAVAYVAPHDMVIKPLKWFPGGYGSLGTEGWQRDGQTVGRRLDPDESAHPQLGFQYRYFQDYTHSRYFDPDKRAETFDMMSRDLGLTKVQGAA